MKGWLDGLCFVNTQEERLIWQILQKFGTLQHFWHLPETGCTSQKIFAPPRNFFFYKKFGLKCENFGLNFTFPGSIQRIILAENTKTKIFGLKAERKAWCPLLCDYTRGKTNLANFAKVWKPTAFFAPPRNRLHLRENFCTSQKFFFL